MSVSSGIEYYRVSRPVGRLGIQQTEEGDVIRFIQFDEAAKQEIQRIIDQVDEIQVDARFTGSEGDPYIKVRRGDGAWLEAFLRLLTEYGLAVQTAEG